jgi:hypothetical protein
MGLSFWIPTEFNRELRPPERPSMDGMLAFMRRFRTLAIGGGGIALACAPMPFGRVRSHLMRQSMVQVSEPDPMPAPSWLRTNTKPRP